MAVTKDQHTGDLKIDLLRQRLRDASAVVSGSNIIKLCNASAELQDSSAPVHCACKDFCRGACFACGCAPCTAATWSFPCGGALCTDPGPLGTGLLCAVDPISGTPTSDACCAVNGTIVLYPSRLVQLFDALATGRKTGALPTPTSQVRRTHAYLHRGGWVTRGGREKRVSACGHGSGQYSLAEPGRT